MDRVVAIPQGHVPWKRAALCAMLALVVVGGWGQTTKRGTKEGTLVVNYYSTAPDPELEQLRQLAIDALGIHLRGEVLLSNEDIGWRRSPKSLQKEMGRIVTDLLSIRNFEGVEPFRGFSVDVLALLTDFEELDRRDVERMRGDSGKSFEARLYILIEQRIQEVLLLAGVEMGRFVNQGLLQQVGSVEQTLPTEALGEWMQFEEGAPLTPLEVDFSLETMSLLNRNDESTWPTGTGSLVQGSQDKGDEALMAMMAQIVDLLARQDERLRALEDKQLGDWARQGINPQRTTTAEDPVLSKLNLPASFDVQFYEGSTRLTLAAQLQLNEVLEYMGMHPSLRVVCTGHADVTGDRTANLNLSKRRAQAVRAHILESGVASTRVLLNYFGEERASNRGALDRRVEVAFFVGD